MKLIKRIILGIVGTVSLLFGGLALASLGGGGLGELNTWCLNGSNNLTPCNSAWGVTLPVGGTSSSNFNINYATPTINFIDSNGDGSIDGSISGNLTDAGVNTEDYDMALAVMEGGIMTTKISIDADAAIALVDSVTVTGNIAPTNGTFLLNDLNNEGTCANGAPDSETINLGLGNRHALDQEDAACQVSFTGGSNVPFGIHVIELQYAGDFAWTFASGAMYTGNSFDEADCTNYQVTRANGDILTLTVLAMDNDTVNVLSCRYNDQ